MNKAELIGAISEKAGLSKKDAEKSLNAFVEAVSDALAAGEKIQLVGFGSFEVKQRAEKEGINPQTKAKIIIPAFKHPVFNAA
jgi:DNA-binding protein HU-beta